MSGVDFRPLFWAGLALGGAVAVVIGLVGFVVGMWLS